MTTLTPQAVLPPDALGLRRLEFRALGTDCRIKFREPRERQALQFAADALDWLGKFEAKFSRFRPESMVSRINAAAGRDWVETDAETERMLDIAADLFRLTEGILDSTVLPLLRVWDWKTVHEKLPETAAVEQARALCGWGKIQRCPGGVFLPKEGMGLDFGGFGKELAVDALARIARNAGIKDALIDLGRDVFAMGGNGAHPFWHVGIEDGNEPGKCWGGLAVSGRAVSASGDHARSFTHAGITYGHILDPRTGWPVRNGMKAVTVVAPTCLEAGIHSTAVFVLGTKKGLELASRSPGVAVCIQNADGIDGTLNFGRWLVQSG
ncbi:MAG: FAD:protein FMN transferase [Verrucomicrobiaceae bacterium]|nr:MAG: FAD:protein FMN transferase [Verrucomicrobiaceae bacterium]